MSQNNLDMRDLNTFSPDQISVSVGRKLYESSIHSHIYNLFSFAFRASNIKFENFRLDTRYYSGVQHLSFERSFEVENKVPQEVDWGFVEQKTAEFLNRIDGVIKSGNKADLFRSYLPKTKDYIENFFIYECMHPKSAFNPYYPLMRIYKNGILISPSDDPDLIKEVEKKNLSLRKKLSIESPLIFKAQGSKKNPGIFTLGNRYNLQVYIFNLLIREKTSHNNPLSIRRILEILEKQGLSIKYDYLQIHVTTPLKKTGLIGSTSDGFFIINDKYDLIASYCFHSKKDESISHILRKYDQISSKYNINNLEDEC